MFVIIWAEGCLQVASMGKTVTVFPACQHSGLSLAVLAAAESQGPLQEVVDLLEEVHGERMPAPSMEEVGRLLQEVRLGS